MARERRRRTPALSRVVQKVAQTSQALAGPLGTGQCTEVDAALEHFIVSLPRPRCFLEVLILRAFMLDAAIRTASLQTNIDPVTRLDWLRDFTSALAEGADPVVAFRTLAGRLAEAHARRDVAPSYIAELKELADASTSTDTVESLARQVGATARHADRQFRRLFGVSIKTYMLRVRALRAMDGIAAGDPLEAVAASLGYHDRKDVYRLLRTVLHMTPAEIRAASPAALARKRTNLLE